MLGLVLVLAPAAQGRTAGDRAAIAVLPQSARSTDREASSAAAIRTAVSDGFVAINAANKKLFACKWRHCTKAGKELRRTAQHWLGVIRPMKGKTKTFARGLSAAKTSLQYWDSTGLDAIHVAAATKEKNQSRFDGWYRLYKKHYKLGTKYQNRAVKILS